MNIPRPGRNMLKPPRRPHPRVSTTFVVGIGTLISLTAAACGGSQASSASQPPIKFGAVVSETGAQAQYGLPAMNGIKLAVADINKSGGINGRKVEVDFRDDAGDRVQAINNFIELATDTSYVGIIGPQSTVAYKPTVPLALQHSVVDFSAGSLGAITWNPWTFRAVTTTSGAMPQYLKLVHNKMPFSTLAIAYDNTNDNNVLEATITKNTAPSLGATVTTTQTFAPGDRDMSSQITAILRNGAPDAVFLAGVTNEAAAFITQLRQRGFKGTIIGGSGVNDPQVFPLTNGLAVGVTSWTGWDPSSSRSEVRRLVSEYKALTGKDAPPQNVAYGYNAVLMMATALKHASKVDRTSLRQQLTNLCGVEAPSGRICFKGPGDSANQPVNVVAYQADGSFKVIASTEKG